MRIYKDKKFLIIFLVLLSSCTSRPIGSYTSHGKRQFVEDSILISRGKNEMKRLVGQPLDEISLPQQKNESITHGDVFEVYILNPFPHPWIESLKLASDSNQLMVVNTQLTMPNFGSIEVVNCEIENVKKKISQLIRKEFPDAVCHIHLKDRLFSRIEVKGVLNVSLPLIKKNETLFLLLSNLNFSKEVSFFDSLIKRRGKAIPVDIEKLMLEGDLSQDVFLLPGDVIYLADTKDLKVAVLGEVNKEGVVFLDKSKASLKEVLAKAGGIKHSANQTSIQVVRGCMKNPKVYTMTYQEVLKSSNSDLLVIQGDIVYVAASPIAEWNRLINQILPSITTYEFFHRGIQGVIIP